MIATEQIDLVFDTFAWIEEFDDGPHAEAVHRQHTSRRVGTPTVVLAEVAHLYDLRAPRMRDDALEAIQSTSELLALTPEIAVKAGRTRARLAKTRKGIGLVDCIIYETARVHDAKLLTGDRHLKGLDGVEFLD